MIIPFIKTCLACNLGILASYPLETMKAREITNNTDIDTYAGIKAPLVMGGISNGIRFQIFKCIKQYNTCIALLAAGVFSGCMFIPFELYKLSQQMKHKQSIVTLQGGHIIMMKEVLLTSIQFYLYHRLESGDPILNIIYGGTSSAIAISVVHPFDVIYVNFMLNNYAPLYTIKNVYLWKGFKYNVLKTFVGYGLTMSIISMIK
tara:strand:+ start:710 stop:1321 length:612 start_codon:yes stop_codon:yes gene_type:complete